ncbi:hypothetical protein ACHAXT_002455 [Thalassiosira profunda]
MATQLLVHARRIAVGGTSGLTGYAAYKSQTDPIHLFWDLDHTILCSISPIPANDIGGEKNSGSTVSKCPVSLNSMLPSPPPLDQFEQIDDDFDFDPQTLSPNTRTYFRPGAQAALRLCSLFATNHVYTAAQESYTNNILTELDPDKSLFGPRVLHRDDYPQIVKEGKNLEVATDNMQRAILFDDRERNFKPQRYENGVAVLPFTPERVANCHGKWGGYIEELQECARLVGISLWSHVHFSGDARKVVKWVRNWKEGKKEDAKS